MEVIFLNYQYFGVKGFSEDQNVDYINKIYKIIDDYKADESHSKEYGILLARMDRRNLNAKVSDHNDGSFRVEFTPKELDEDLKKRSHEAEFHQKEMLKYSSLKLWSDFLTEKF